MADTLHFSILLVDDEPRSAHGSRRVSPEEAARGPRSGSVAEALKRIAQEPADIILSDFKMPDRTGLDLLREVQSSNRKPPSSSRPPSARLKTQCRQCGRRVRLSHEAESTLKGLTLLIQRIGERQRFCRRTGCFANNWLGAIPSLALCHNHEHGTVLNTAAVLHTQGRQC
jgi:CheY-like chemotaxis protein